MLNFISLLNIIYIYMKTRIFAVIFAIAMICVGNANAQYYNYGRGLDNVDFSVSLSGGAMFINEFTSPVASVRLGADFSRFIGELEFSYLSINAVDESCYGGVEKASLSTVVFGVNLGVKLLRGRAGYLAAAIHTGYAMQEEWLLDDCHSCYGPRHDRYNGAGYFGVGLNGTVRIASRFGLFGDVRFQSIPYDGTGESKWGGVLQGGVRFYF